MTDEIEKLLGEWNEKCAKMFDELYKKFIGLGYAPEIALDITKHLAPKTVEIMQILMIPNVDIEDWESEVQDAFNEFEEEWDKDAQDKQE